MKGKFSNVSAKSGAPFQRPLTSRGVAFGDLDNDGFLDIVMNCNDEAAVISAQPGRQWKSLAGREHGWNEKQSRRHRRAYQADATGRNRAIRLCLYRFELSFGK